tara:strand:- start:185 stop:292 length:108 start_codon:yes stop_codon:yes gene_type:complete
MLVVVEMVINLGLMDMRVTHTLVVAVLLKVVLVIL